MTRRPLAIALAHAQRTVLSLALAGMLLPWAGGPAAPVRADDSTDQRPPRNPRDIAARLELVVKSIHIISDRDDWDAGDIRVSVSVFKYTDECVTPIAELVCHNTTDIARSAPIEFTANSRETFILNRTVPESGGFASDPIALPGIGIPVYADQRYGFLIKAVDADLLGFVDDLGELSGQMYEQNDWGPVGTYTERGTMNDAGNVLDPGCVGCPALFSVEYEIRRVPHADVVARSFRYDAERDAVCMGVTNQGERDAYAFDVNFFVDASSTRGFEMSNLAVGENRETCFDPNLPPGEYAVTFTVNDGRQIPEMDERNNRYESKFVIPVAALVGPQPAVAPGASTNPGSSGLPPAPVPGQADLAVTALRINGQQPSGNNDCDPGMNDVTVAIKNQGNGAAANFAARVADNKENAANEKSVANLGGDQELDVAFEDLRLSKGEHKLTATVDAKKTITESKEGNNELTVIVNCKDKGH